MAATERHRATRSERRSGRPDPDCIVVVSSLLEPAARCLVCGGEVEAGGGLTAMFEGRPLRFRCEGCLAQFAADPDRFLADHPAHCCDDPVATGAFSEWTCD